MHSEQLTNLHAGWVVGGWLVAVAVTSAVYVGGLGLGLAASEGGAAVWVTLSLAVGFFAGGLSVGLRWVDAPILHGTAITLFSVVVWFAVSLASDPGPFESMPMVLGLVLVQLVSSVAGGWTGRRLSLQPTSTDGSP